MTCRYRALVSIVVLAGTPGVVRAQDSVHAQTTTQTAPATPAAQTAPAERRVDKTRMMPQGFSVVLVLADIQATSGTDDVPPAARKALVDMKDFLPYKSYKLLDAAWLLCCGPGAGEVTSRMKGPEEQDYELRLSASQSRESQNPDTFRVFVHFALRELNEGAPDSAMALAQALTAEQQSEIAKQKDQIAQLEIALAGLKAAQPVTPERRDERRRLEAQIDHLKQRLAQEGRSTRRSTRPMMDTNFTMDVGETVVVGTSRLKGGSKALIAMLTAVPPRAERKE